MKAPPRLAFTLIELLVVIAIIGILMGLLLAAVQRVRGAAARLECANNLKQIGIATHQYHDQWGAFPAGMRWRRAKDPYRMSSWLTHLLPFVEREALWKKTQLAYRQKRYPIRNNPPHVGLTTVVPLFSCPADGRALSVQIAQRERIPIALTNYLGVSGKNLDAKDGVLFRDSRVRIADIRDGTSQTLFAGERPPSADFQFGWWYAGAGQRFTGSGDMFLGVEEQNILPVTVGSCPPGFYKFSPGRDGYQCDMFHFWSHHTGGAHFLVADGSVHFFTYSVAPLMPALASRAGQDVASIP